MKYGYYNYYITDIGENVTDIVAELNTQADEVVTEALSYSPKYFELLEKVKPGDELYVYDIQRSCGGLLDLIDTLKMLLNKDVKFVSMRDGIVVDNTESGQAAMKALLVASTLVGVDPIHGKFC